MDLSRDLEGYDDLESFDGRASVASSDWANISSTSSTAGQPLTAKDIANRKELWEAWSSNQHFSTVNAECVAIDHHMSQIISGVFQYSHHIPNLWFYLQHNYCSNKLQERLTQIAQINPGFLEGENVSPPADSGRVLMLAATALDIHEAALRISRNQSASVSDDIWTSEIHNALIIRCARGRLLGLSRPLELPALQFKALDQPAVSQLLGIRRIRARGGIPALSPNEDHSHESFFAAVFSTRSEIPSQLRDMPDYLSLYAFSNMAASALVRQLSDVGMNAPVFGVMCDRNIVRFHVVWSVSLPDSNDKGIASLPLPHGDQSSEGALLFKELDLTRADDALRVAFMLDAMHAYAEKVLAPAVRVAIMNEESGNKLQLLQEELTSAEKVAAWRHYRGNDDTVFVEPHPDVYN